MLLCCAPMACLVCAADGAYMLSTTLVDMSRTLSRTPTHTLGASAHTSEDQRCWREMSARRDADAGASDGGRHASIYMLAIHLHLSQPSTYAKPVPATNSSCTCLVRASAAAPWRACVWGSGLLLASTCQATIYIPQQRTLGPTQTQPRAASHPRLPPLDLLPCG